MIPVLLKLMTDVFDMFVSSIALDFNVSVSELKKNPFTARSHETVRDGGVIEPLLEIKKMLLLLHQYQCVVKLRFQLS